MSQYNPNMDEVVRQAGTAVEQLETDGHYEMSEVVRLLIEERETFQMYSDDAEMRVSDAIAERNDLQVKVAEQDKQLNNFKAAWDEQVEEVRSLRAGYTTANARRDEELYYWEPFAENHLETLTGGVVIRAEWIRQLIQEAKAEQDKEIQRLNGLIKSAHDEHTQLLLDS